MCHNLFLACILMNNVHVWRHVLCQTDGRLTHRNIPHFIKCVVKNECKTLFQHAVNVINYSHM